MERVYRWYVKLRITLNVDPVTISRELRTIYGDNAPSNLDIEKWMLNQHQQSLTNVPFEEPSTDISLKDAAKISTENPLETDDASFSYFRSFTSSFSFLFSNMCDTVFSNPYL